MALRAGLDAVVEDLDKVVQAVLVHRIYEREISHDKVQQGALLGHNAILLPCCVYLCLVHLLLYHLYT